MVNDVRAESGSRPFLRQFQEFWKLLTLQFFSCLSYRQMSILTRIEIISGGFFEAAEKLFTLRTGLHREKMC